MGDSQGHAGRAPAGMADDTQAASGGQVYGPGSVPATPSMRAKTKPSGGAVKNPPPEMDDAN